jgi:amino acid transporter
MTGIEAVSNGVPAFKSPESRNAATTMLWMSGILGTLFVGIVALFFAYGLVPDPSGNPTLLSQLTEQVVGRSWFYYVVQGATLLVLVLAANTSYADFPRLAAILARDDFVPHLFGFRGDRLAFSVGISALSILAALLLFLFHGNVDALIPLFAVGVFVAFTMSQAGMVVHWRRERGPGWRTKAVINGLGAVASAIVHPACGRGADRRSQPRRDPNARVCLFDGPQRHRRSRVRRAGRDGPPAPGLASTLRDPSVSRAGAAAARPQSVSHVDPRLDVVH